MVVEEAQKKRIVVVGGGPAGASVAKALADVDAGKVLLFEAYPHPENIEKNSPKAYVIALGLRGQRGIEITTGLDPLVDIENAVVGRHMTRHPQMKTMLRYAPSLIVPWQFLTSHLLKVAQESGVDISFQHRLVDIDLAKKIATFEETSTATVETIPYDLLIGADGSNSKVRSLLHHKKKVLSADGDFSVTRVEQDSMEYQVAVLPPAEAAAVYEGIPETSTHVWNNKKYNSICLAFPLAQIKECCSR